MKKIGIVLGVSLGLFLLSATPVSATIERTKDGYVLDFSMLDEEPEDTVDYCVSDIRTNANFDGTGICLERKVTCDARITPERTIAWKETDHGREYGGTLSLYKVRYQNGRTAAYYKGTLFLQE